MKLVRVNMSNKTVRTEEVSGAYLGLGGRGFASIMINAEVAPDCDPLGPDNKLVFAPGLLGGTPLTNAGRISIGAKSPLTNTIRQSSAGGTVANALGRLGIAAIIIEGKPANGDVSFLKIDTRGRASLLPAQPYKGKRTYNLVSALLADHGEKNAVLCIGPAGEHQMAIASIQSTDADGRPSLPAGRGGIGAVMGAKGLKALIIDQKGNQPDPISDPRAFKTAHKDLVKALKSTARPDRSSNKTALMARTKVAEFFFGMHAGVQSMRGWEQAHLAAMARMIRKWSGNTIHADCDRCNAHYTNEFIDENGKYITSSLEYETIWATGVMTGIKDLSTIARIDYLCDDIGADTVGVGLGMAVAMDSGYKSLGDHRAAVEMLQEIAAASPFGKILGNGPMAVSKHFNSDDAPGMKNRRMVADIFKTIQTDEILCSVCAIAAGPGGGNGAKAYPGPKHVPRKVEEGLALSKDLRIAKASVDCTGLCFRVAAVLKNPAARQAFLKLINAKFGTHLGPDDLWAMGMRVLKAENEFNRKAANTHQDVHGFGSGPKDAISGWALSQEETL